MKDGTIPTCYVDCELNSNAFALKPEFYVGVTLYKKSKDLTGICMQYWIEFNISISIAHCIDQNHKCPLVAETAASPSAFDHDDDHKHNSNTNNCNDNNNRTNLNHSINFSHENNNYRNHNNNDDDNDSDNPHNINNNIMIATTMITTM